MAANIDPIFALTPKAAFAQITAANTAKDGTGTVSTVATAGANSAMLEDIRCLPKGTNVASVLRVFLNNGGSAAVAANNSLWFEATLPSSTLTETSQQTPVIIPMNRAIPAGYNVNICIGTAVAAGWSFVGTWGDF